jgi:septal ring factor EnvC (AmiA/AmiB activator)
MEKEATPIETPAQIDEAQKLWQEYLQKCCEVGQLDHALTQLAGQQADIEKNLDVTKRAVKTLAHKHREHQQALAAKVQMPKATETAEAH